MGQLSHSSVPLELHEKHHAPAAYENNHINIKWSTQRSQEKKKGKKKIEGQCPNDLYF